MADIVKRAAANETTDIATGPTRADAESRLFRDLDDATRGCGRWRASPRIPSPRSRRRWSRRRSGSALGGDRDSLPPRRQPPEHHQRRTAERLKATWHEMDTGHYPMLSAPDELTGLLLK